METKEIPLLAEVLKLTLERLQQRTIRPRFRMPLSEAEVTSLLTLSYMRLVYERGQRSMVADKATTENIHRVAAWLTDESHKPMMLLAGGVGNGKTTMAKAVSMSMNAFKEQLQERIKQGFCQVPQEQTKLMYDMREYMFKYAPRTATAQDLANLASRDKDAFDLLAASPFLIIDDLGCEPREVKNYGTSVTPITDILFQRYDKMMPTMVTTNLTMQEIQSMYGNRIADRFAECFETIGYTTKSYRQL